MGAKVPETGREEPVKNVNELSSSSPSFLFFLPLVANEGVCVCRGEVEAEDAEDAEECKTLKGAEEVGGGGVGRGRVGAKVPD